MLFIEINRIRLHDLVPMIFLKLQLSFDLELTFTFSVLSTVPESLYFIPFDSPCSALGYGTKTRQEGGLCP